MLEGNSSLLIHHLDVTAGQLRMRNVQLVSIRNVTCSHSSSSTPLKSDVLANSALRAGFDAQAWPSYYAFAIASAVPGEVLDNDGSAMAFSRSLQSIEDFGTLAASYFWDWGRFGTSTLATELASRDISSFCSLRDATDIFPPSMVLIGTDIPSLDEIKRADRVAGDPWDTSMVYPARECSLIGMRQSSRFAMIAGMSVLTCTCSRRKCVLACVLLQVCMSSHFRPCSLATCTERNALHCAVVGSTNAMQLYLKPLNNHGVCH